MFLKHILGRLPKFKDVIPVYASIAFMVYGWTFFTSFRYLNYWMGFLNTGEIFAIISYAMLADLTESIFLLLVLLGICVVLPPRFLKDNFVLRGTFIVASVLLSVFIFLNIFPDLDRYYNTAFLWLIGTCVFVLVGVSVFTKSRIISRIVTWFSDSVVIFLYILMPMTVLSLFVVLIRNLI